MPATVCPPGTLGVHNTLLKLVREKCPEVGEMPMPHTAYSAVLQALVISRRLGVLWLALYTSLPEEVVAAALTAGPPPQQFRIRIEERLELTADERTILAAAAKSDCIPAPGTLARLARAGGRAHAAGRFAQSSTSPASLHQAQSCNSVRTDSVAG